MAEKYTLEQLMEMGAKPVKVAPEERLTLEEVQAQGAQDVPTVGSVETFLNRAANALPGGRPVVDALSALTMQASRANLLPDALSVQGERATLTPQARAELEAMGETVQDVPGLVDDYRRLRDTRRIRTAAGSEQNPNAARAGTAAGIGLSIAAPLPKVTVGSGRAGRIGSAAATGAAYGALSGLTDGDADLTRGEVGQAARETLEGAAAGGLIGGAAGGAVEAARGLAGPLRNLAVRQTKQTIQGGSDIAAATREPLKDASALEVLRSGGIRPFSTTQATAQRIEAMARESGDEYGRIVAALEARGVSGPQAEAVADELLSRGAMLESRTLNEALPEEFVRRAEGLLRAQRAGGQRGLSLTQAEDLKRSMQDMARYGKLEETPLNAVRREIGSVIRQANEDAVERAAQAAAPGSEVRTLADRFVPVKQRTGLLLDAERFAQKGATKAEQRSPVSFKDLLVGGMTGEPVSGLAMATGSSIARNRLPSTVASGAFGLSEGLRTGSLSGSLAQGLGGAAELGVDEARDRANRTPITRDMDPITAALIRALRTRPNPNDAPEARR